MKVKLFTEGGKNIGFGHITRCLSLCEAFEEKGGTCLFVIKGGKEVQALLNKPLKLLDWVENLDAFEEELKDVDALIIDSYLAKREHYELACKRVKRCLFVDDFNRLEYPCGLVLNGSVYAHELEYPKKEGVSYLLGTEYIPLRRAFWHVEEKEIKDEVKRILITFGGDDSKGMSLRIVKMLEENFPEVEKLVVVGAGFKEKERLYSFASERLRLYENLSAEEMKNLMLSADLAISAGGQTTYELARVGLPAVLVAVAENQLLNCKSWEREGFAIWAGWWEDKNLEERIREALLLLWSKKERLVRHYAGRRLVDGKGAIRAVEELLDYTLA
ncbi:MAG: UDP-2,4-diacetamido-2,4,6-trideoxy-beta-L-altropyranose hydrolase, partial [Aquificota bacterium]